MKNHCELNSLKPGSKTVITGFSDSSKKTIDHLKIMGITIGKEIEVLNKFLGRDPILIKTRNGRIALRKSEAQHIFVEDVCHE